MAGRYYTLYVKDKNGWRRQHLDTAYKLDMARAVWQDRLFDAAHGAANPAELRVVSQRETTMRRKMVDKWNMLKSEDDESC